MKSHIHLLGQSCKSAMNRLIYFCFVPIMLVIGDKDVLFDIEETRNQFEKTPEARAFVVLDNHSHIGMVWSDESAAVLAQFFENPDSVQNT